MGVHLLHRHHQEDHERAHVSDDGAGVDGCYEGVDEVTSSQAADARIYVELLEQLNGSATNTIRYFFTESRATS